MADNIFLNYLNMFKRKNAIDLVNVFKVMKIVIYIS